MQLAEPVLTNLLDQIRRASCNQLILFARQPAFEVEVVESQGLPFVQQMTHILITSNALEISFKTHFMLRDAIRLTCGKLAVAEASATQGIDFMKEFCNLVAGKTKAMLEGAGMAAAQSLPIAIQGYNEIFYPRVEASFAHAAWRLRTDAQAVCCSAAVTLRGPEQLASLARVTYQEEFLHDIGDVELF